MMPFAYRVNVSAAFPTQVVGKEGVEVSRANGIYSIGSAYETLAPLGSVPVPAQKVVKVYDSVTGVYNTVPLSVLPGGGGGGGGGFNITVVTSLAGYNATVNDDLILVERVTGGSTTVTLVASVTRLRGPVYIKDGKGDADVNHITVLFNGTEKCDGLSSVGIVTQFGVLALAPNPAGGWVVLNFG
jgi:hypothetical protein